MRKKDGIDKGHRESLSGWKTTCFLAVVATVWQSLADRGIAAEPGRSPYPPSPVIARVEFDWSTRKDLAPGSDNWPITWAKDGEQYTSWGDGGGFGGTNSRGRVSLGVARVVGGPDDYRGINTWGGWKSKHRATFGGKCYGILDIDGRLYMWLRQVDRTHARLAYSHDRAATWKKAPWDFSPKDHFSTGTFLQFGPGYKGARDNFVYAYFIRSPNPTARVVVRPGKIDLTRVPKDRVLDRSAYEFFAGLDDKGKPRWVRDLKKRQPVFVDPRGVGWVVNVTYNRGLKRYLLSTEHTRHRRGHMTLADAPEPWGPWTIVPMPKRFPGWTLCFSNKWTSRDGREFTAIFTPEDNWATVRGRFVLR